MIPRDGLSIKIKRINRKELFGLSSSPATGSMLRTIKKELIGGDVAFDRFIQRYATLLDTDSQMVKESPSTNRRGTEIYIVTAGKAPIGFVFLNFYSWSVLAPQMSVRVGKDGSERSFSLRPFAELVNLSRKPAFASELFIMWVAPAYRGVGVGRAMFSHAMTVMSDFLSAGDIGFLTVRSGLNKRKSTGLFSYLQDVEKNAHGENSSGKVTITGLSASNETIRTYTGVDYDSIPVHPAAIAMEILAKQASFRFIGYTSKGSTIYSKVW